MSFTLSRSPTASQSAPLIDSREQVEHLEDEQDQEPDVYRGEIPDVGEMDASRAGEDENSSKVPLNMTDDCYTNRPLFGGAIASTFPDRFQDVSNVRQVPDHQEAYVDPGRDESLIFELLDLKCEVADNGSAAWFFQDLASEQDADGSTLIEQSAIFEAEWLLFRNMPAVITTAVGQMAISKGRQGREAQNIVKVYLANLRLKEVSTDVLITAYEPLLINHLSESASVVGAGLAVPAAQSGFVPMAEVFKHVVSSFKVNDWSLFGGPA